MTAYLKLDTSFPETRNLAYQSVSLSATAHRNSDSQGVDHSHSNVDAVQVTEVAHAIGKGASKQEEWEREVSIFSHCLELQGSRN